MSNPVCVECGGDDAFDGGRCCSDCLEFVVVRRGRYDHELRCTECRDGLARTLWMNANGDVPGTSHFWDYMPWEEKREWIAEAGRIADSGGDA